MRGLIDLGALFAVLAAFYVLSVLVLAVPAWLAHKRRQRYYRRHGWYR